MTITIMDLIIKVLLFFTVFYGAIMLTSYASKIIRDKVTKAEEKKDEKSEKRDSDLNP